MKKRAKTVDKIAEKAHTLQNVFSKSKRLLAMRNTLSEILPLEMQAQAQLANYRQGILVMHISSAAFATRLRMLAPHLLRRLAQTHIFSDIKTIDIKVRPQTGRQQRELPVAPLSDYGDKVLRSLQHQLKKLTQ